MSSSYLFFGLPTALHALAPMLRPGFHFAAFFVHLVSGCEAILIANIHFIFLCVSIQQGTLAALIFSSASFVLLFMCSIPIFLFNFCRVDVFVSVIHERNFTVLVAICV